MSIRNKIKNYSNSCALYFLLAIVGILTGTVGYIAVVQMQMRLLNTYAVCTPGTVGPCHQGDWCTSTAYDMGRC